MSWFLALFLACSSGPTEPSPAVEPAPAAAEALEAVVLYASPKALVVHHEGTKDRIVAGAAVYEVPVPELTSDLAPGDRVTLKTRERKGSLQVSQVREIGSGPLPEGASSPYPLTGTVVNTEPHRVTVDHEAIEGFMGAMVMSFLTSGPDAERLKGGDRIEGTLVGTPTGFALVEIRKVGEGDAALREDIQPLSTGEVFPRIEVPISEDQTLVVGEGQGQRTALTFLYTTCPDPTFCPALAARLQALQGEIAGEARIVAITIDPEIDQFHVLKRYASGMSADPGTWYFGRLEPEWLQRTALLSGMVVSIENGRIAHLMRMLILDRDGTILERYDDNEWPLERVASQLKSGEPRQPPGQQGSRYDR